jgi:predicted Zn-dependent protease
MKRPARARQGKERRAQGTEKAGPDHRSDVPSLSTPERHPPTRLPALLVALLLAAGAYMATGGWRHRLQQESARSRQVIAAVERSRREEEQRAARQQELAALLASRPDDGAARLELAQLRWREAGPGGAVAVLQQGGRDPSDPRLLVMLANAQRLLGREDRALAALDRAARRAPGDGRVEAERAMLLSLLGWFPQARAALRVAEHGGADPVELSLVRVTMARQHGDLRAARRELEAAQARDPTNPEVVKQLAAVAESEGRLAEAERLLEPLAAQGEPEVLIALARMQLRRDEPEARARAKAAVQRALALRPGIPAARRLLGRCLRLEGDMAGARAVLEPLYRERPDQPGAAFELAQLYRSLGMQDRVPPLLARHSDYLRQRAAMHRAALAVMAHPERASAHLEMGRLCLEHGMVGRAILSLQRVLALDPSLPGARQLLARARRTAGNPGGGEE